MMWIHHDSIDAKDKEEYPLSSPKNHAICTGVLVTSFLLLMLTNLYVYFKNFKSTLCIVKTLSFYPQLV